MAAISHIIEEHFVQRQSLTPQNASPELRDALDEVMMGLDEGSLRVAENIQGTWVVHQWIKKAILLSFKIYSNQIIDAGFCQFYDKLPLKFTNMTPTTFSQKGIRVVPHAMVRRGAFVGKHSVLMPSYVNIGAYIDEGAMIDTWATVGSCAQIGKPLQAHPTIIEDNCFIGARSEVVEGVIVECGSVISMGVFLGQSTKIYNRLTGEISYGRIPAGSVVVAGNLPSKDASHSLYCAVIVKQVDEATRAKVSINELLRDTE
jgi:2,3,4,5-tetrahydropyridine-2-carboxylate N-succinyltransferase